MCGYQRGRSSPSERNEPRNCSHVDRGPFFTLNCIGPPQQPSQFSPR
jgi:hypothetical protein